MAFALAQPNVDLESRGFSVHSNTEQEGHSSSMTQPQCDRSAAADKVWEMFFAKYGEQEMWTSVLEAVIAPGSTDNYMSTAQIWLVGTLNLMKVSHANIDETCMDALNALGQALASNDEGAAFWTQDPFPLDEALTIVWNFNQGYFSDHCGEDSSSDDGMPEMPFEICEEFPTPAPTPAPTPPPSCPIDGIIIDAFTTPQNQLVLDNTLQSVQTTAQTSGDDILGGFRFTKMDKIDGTFFSKSEASVFPDFGFAWQNGATRTSIVTLRYDGNGDANLDAAGLGGVDLTAFGTADKMEIDFITQDLELVYIVTVHDTLGGSSTLQRVILDDEQNFEILPFSSFGGNADFTRVGAIEIQFTSGSQVDALVRSIKIVCDESQFAPRGQSEDKPAWVDCSCPANTEWWRNHLYQHCTEDCECVYSSCFWSRYLPSDILTDWSEFSAKIWGEYLYTFGSTFFKSGVPIRHVFNRDGIYFVVAKQFIAAKLNMMKVGADNLDADTVSFINGVQRKFEFCGINSLNPVCEFTADEAQQLYAFNTGNGEQSSCNEQTCPSCKRSQEKRGSFGGASDMSEQEEMYDTLHCYRCQPCGGEENAGDSSNDNGIPSELSYNYKSDDSTSDGFLPAKNQGAICARPETQPTNPTTTQTTTTQVLAELEITKTDNVDMIFEESVQTYTITVTARMNDVRTVVVEDPFPMEWNVLDVDPRCQITAANDIRCFIERLDQDASDTIEIVYKRDECAGFLAEPLNNCAFVSSPDVPGGVRQACDETGVIYECDLRVSVDECFFPGEEMVVVYENTGSRACYDVSIDNSVMTGCNRDYTCVRPGVYDYSCSQPAVFQDYCNTISISDSMEQKDQDEACVDFPCVGGSDASVDRVVIPFDEPTDVTWTFCINNPSEPVTIESFTYSPFGNTEWEQSRTNCDAAINALPGRTTSQTFCCEIVTTLRSTNQGRYSADAEFVLNETGCANRQKFVSLSADFVETEGPRLFITKDDHITTITEGEEYTYTIFVTARDAGAEGVVIEDNFPAELTFLDFADTRSALRCSENNGFIRCDVGSLAKDETVALKIAFRREICAGRIESVTNTAITYGDNLETVSASDTDNFEYPSLLTIEYSEDCYAAGEVLQVTVANNGPSGAYSTRVSSTVSNCARNYVCLAPGETETYNCEAPSRTNDFFDTVTISADSTDSTDSDTAEIDVPAQWALSKKASPAISQIPFGSNTDVTWELCIENPSEDIYVNGEFLSTFVVTATGQTGWMLGDDFSDCQAKLNALPNAPTGGKTISNTFCCDYITTLNPNTQGEFNCAVEVEVGEEGCKNNRSQRNAQDGPITTQDPALELTKTDNVAQITEGSTYTYTITATALVANADNVIIRDTWPSQLTFLGFGTTPSRFGCATTSTGFQCNVGSMSPGDSRSVFAVFRRDVCAGRINTVRNCAEATTESNPAIRATDCDTDNVVCDVELTISAPTCISDDDQFELGYSVSGPSGAYGLSIRNDRSTDCNVDETCVAPGQYTETCATSSVAGGDYVATTTISSECAASDKSVETEVNRRAEWSVTKRPSTTLINFEETTPVTWEHCIDNVGSDDIYIPNTFNSVFRTTETGETDWIISTDTTACQSALNSLDSIGPRKIVRAQSKFCCTATTVLRPERYSAAGLTCSDRVVVLEEGCAVETSTNTVSATVFSTQPECPVDGFTIDTFDTPQDELLTLNVNEALVSGVTTAGDDIIGGARRIAVRAIGGQPNSEATVEVVGSPAFAFAWQNGVTRTSEAALIYDGSTTSSGTVFSLNPTGLRTNGQGVDMTFFGLTDQLDIVFLALDLDIEVTVTVYTDANNFSRFSALAQTVATGNVVSINHSQFNAVTGAGADFENVGAVSFFFTSDDSVDAVIDGTRIPCPDGFIPGQN